MVRYFLLLLVVVLVSVGVCLQSSCGGEQEAASTEGAAGCGCNRLRRAASGAADSKEERPSSEPAVKYTAAANEKISQVRRVDRKLPVKYIVSRRGERITWICMYE